MTPAKPQRKPTGAELEILSALWKIGPSTVREIQEELGGESATGYTTVLKLLQIMHDKGLVKRDESRRAHVYEARAPREVTQRGLVRDLIERGFEGSTQALVLRALETRTTSPRELREIRRLLERLDPPESS